MVEVTRSLSSQVAKLVSLNLAPVAIFCATISILLRSEAKQRQTEVEGR